MSAVQNVEAPGIAALIRTCRAASVCVFLQLVAPDHICTLISLSGTTPTDSALLVGGTWGFAHCLGTTMVCGLFACIRFGQAIDVETWEHIGDYCIGISLICCALYFIAYENKFLVKGHDGGYVVKGCACHGYTDDQLSSAEYAVEDVPSVEDLEARRPRLKRQKKSRLQRGQAKRFFTTSLGPDSSSGCTDCGSDHSIESIPLLGDGLSGGVRVRERSVMTPWLSSALLGIFQGVCCPMALTSASFLMTTPSVVDVSLFLTAYVVGSVVTSGLFAFVWSKFVHGGFCKRLSPLHLYRWSCAFMLIFGICWVIANLLDCLEMVNYSEWVKKEGTP